jgi:uncharacterized protein YydD (DUF2326 family)
MLRRLSSNHESFAPIVFDAGFNVILAERAPDATETHSRNARGKTTVLQIINFCLGANLSQSLRPLVEQEWAFTLTLDLFGDAVTVTRPLRSGSKVKLSYGDAAAHVIDPYVEDSGNVSIDDWKFLLGLGLFGLDDRADERKYKLSPRTLLSYILRLDALKDPFKVIAQQPAWSSREHISFLVGLDWSLISDLTKIASEAEAFKALRFASSERLLPGILPDESDLLLERAQTVRVLEDIRARITGFQVIDDPNNLVRQADEMTEHLRELRNQSLVDRRLLDLYSSSVQEDPEEESYDVESLYADLGVAFRPEALRRLEDVERFHERLISNRRVFLRAEIEALRIRESEREEEITRIATERNQIMAALEAGGALEELTALYEQVNEAKSRLAAIEAALQNVRELAEAEEGVRLRKAQKRQESVHELASNRDRLDEFSGRVDAMMRRLYNRSAALTVDVDDSGFRYSIKVSGVSSSGITRMQMLCFDLALMSYNSTWTRHPDFLVHDSVIFDGVDPRQVSAALELVHETVESINGQYLCTMNSSDIPDEIADQAWFKEGIRRVVYDTDEGGILGVSF